MKNKKKILKGKKITHLTLLISGIALILFSILSLISKKAFNQIPLNQEIILILISLLSIAYILERTIKVGKSNIYENFYSLYLGFVLIALAVLYWVSVLNQLEIGIFRNLVALTYIVVFLFSLITINHSEELWFIVVSYIFTALVTIILFAYIYWTLSVFGLGELQYDTCNSLIQNLKSENWFYFSSVTFYALGYGDICPIGGLTRVVSQLQVGIGVIVNSVLIGFIFWKIREINPYRKKDIKTLKYRSRA